MELILSAKALPQQASPAVLTAAQTLYASTPGYRHSNGLGEHAERATSGRERHFATQRVDRQYLSAVNPIPKAALFLRTTASWSKVHWHR